MQRGIQGHYVPLMTVGEPAPAFIPRPLPPIDWSPSFAVMVMPDQVVDTAQQLEIVHDMTEKRRNRIFRYGAYLQLMDQGTELP